MNHTASPRSEFLRGIKETSPMLIGLLPWALILGMQGGQKGMSWLEMLLMTGMNLPEVRNLPQSICGQILCRLC